MSDVYKHLVLFLLRHFNWMERFSTMKIGRFFFVRVYYDITQTELLFAQSLQSICSVYVDTPRVILLVTDFFIKQPETCSTMRALKVLSYAFSVNASACQGACKCSLFKSIGVSPENQRCLPKQLWVFARHYARNIFRFDF